MGIFDLLLQKKKARNTSPQENGAKLKAVVDDQKELICRFLPDGTLTFANDAYCRYYGKPRKSLLGKRYFEHIPKKIVGQEKKRLTQFTPSNPVMEVEHRAIDKNGWHRWQQWTTKATFNKKNKLVEFQSVGRDITEQKYTEESLRKSEESYRNLADNSLLGIYRADLEGNYLYVNEAMAKMFDFDSPEEMIREGGRVRYENQAAREKFHNLLKEKKKLTNYELIGITRKGRKINILSSAILSKDERMGMILDITQRKKVEKDLLNLSRLYAVLYKVNEAIIQIRSEEQLLGEICRIISRDGEFPLVWIGNVAGTDVEPIASAGQATNYLQGIKIKTAGELSKGPTGTCVRENKSVINNDFGINPSTAPWRKSALAYGFRSSAAFPLLRNKKVVGALTLYSEEPAIFDRNQIKLLETLAADISFALDTLKREKMRLKAEALLLNAKEEWERTFDSVPDLIAILDGKHQIMRVNRAMAERLGTNKEKCAGLNCYTCVHNADKPIAACPHALTLADGKEHVAEVEEPNLGGTFLVSTTPFFGSDGKLIGSVHVARDITERKKSEEKMADLAKFPLENPNPIMRIDTRGKLMFANKAADILLKEYDYSGDRYAPGELKKIVLPAINNGTKQNFETSIGGRSFLVLVAPIEGANYANVYFTDVTELKTAQIALSYEKEKLKQILDNMEDGVYIADQYYNVSYVNPALEKYFGSNLGNKKCFEYLHGLKSPCLWCMNREVFLGKSVRWEYYFSKLKKTFDIIETPMVTPEDTHIKLQIMRDVTEKKKMEKAKDDFISLASHQLRTPLSAIGLSSELLLRGISGKVADEQKEYLEEIHKATKRMTILVNNLLNISRIEMGTFSVEAAPLDTLAVLESKLKEFKPSILEKHLVLEKKFAENIPPPLFNANSFDMVVDNLLSNAIRYTPAGGKIILVLKQKKDGLILEVSDTGCGIPKSQQTEIFSKSFRADNAKKISSEGAGLGLYMVSEIANRTGAKVWFKSTEGKGSTFYFSIPLR